MLQMTTLLLQEACRLSAKNLGLRARLTWIEDKSPWDRDSAKINLYAGPDHSIPTPNHCEPAHELAVTTIKNGTGCLEGASVVQL